MFRLPLSLGLAVVSMLVMAGPARAGTIYIYVPEPIYELYPLPKCVETHPQTLVPPPLGVPEPLHDLGMCIEPT